MRVFLTGATGFIGSTIVQELLGAGHQVLGLTRSDAGAASLTAAGAEAHRGDIEDLESLRSGAAQVDGVIHCAFNHDFSKFVQNCENDRAAIEAIGEAIKGTGKPFVVTSATGMGNAGTGEPASEDHFNLNHQNPRVASEVAVNALAESGVNTRVVRLPQVHDTRKQGLVSYLIEIARKKGVSAYVGDGANRWPAAHVLDTAQLYRLALEKGTAGGRYHAVGEEGIPVRMLAEAVGLGLKIPVVSKTQEEAGEHFGWLGAFAAFDMPASSALTQQRLGWKPVEVGMLDDLEHAENFKA